jgi:hypothetical protein
MRKLIMLLEMICVFYEGIMETCFVELLTDKRKTNIIVGEIYRVPNTSEAFSLKEYNKLLQIINEENKEIIIGTDQNLDYLKTEMHENTSKMLDINFNHLMLPTITKPTRITHSTATLIDNIYISKNLQTDFKSAILVDEISDHLPCLTLIKQTRKWQHTQQRIKYRKIDETGK